MATEVTWLGHSTFEIEINTKKFLIDPFLTGNPLAAKTANDISPDAIILTHGHGDHVGDAVAIAKRTGAGIVSNFEICQWLTKAGIQKVHAQHIGGAHRFNLSDSDPSLGSVTIKLTIAHHGSMLPDGSNGGNPCGVLLKTADGTIYHAGDTGLFYDMKLIGEEGIDLALLPIGDNFTMGPEDALRAVQLIEPRKVIPMHYNTWDLIAQDPQTFADAVRRQTKAEPIVLKPGQSCRL